MFFTGSEGHEPHRELRLVRRRDVSALADVRDDLWKIVRCTGCRHCYLNPAPSPESFRQYYGSDYFSADESAPANQVLSLTALTAQDRFLFARSRSIACRDRTGPLLDIGPGNHFQVVTLWWILENVYRADDYLRECFHILKPGGLLAVGVCDFGCPEAKLFGSYWHHLVLPEHLSQFTPDTLRATVGRAGFGEPALCHQLLHPRSAATAHPGQPGRLLLHPPQQTARPAPGRHLSRLGRRFFPAALPRPSAWLHDSGDSGLVPGSRLRRFQDAVCAHRLSILLSSASSARLRVGSWKRSFFPKQPPTA